MSATVQLKKKAKGMDSTINLRTEHREGFEPAAEAREGRSAAHPKANRIVCAEAVDRAFGKSFQQFH